MIDIDIKYIFLCFLVIIFFIYGLTLSEIIDYIFPDHDSTLPDYRVALEIIGEIGIAYIIYFCLDHYSKKLINTLYNKISSVPPHYLNQLLLIAFSSGIYKHLYKSTHKTNYMKSKIINKFEWDPKNYNFIMKWEDS